MASGTIDSYARAAGANELLVPSQIDGCRRTRARDFLGGFTNNQTVRLIAGLELKLPGLIAE